MVSRYLVVVVDVAGPVWFYRSVTTLNCCLIVLRKLTRQLTAVSKVLDVVSSRVFLRWKRLGTVLVLT